MSRAEQFPESRLPVQAELLSVSAMAADTQLVLTLGADGAIACVTLIRPGLSLLRADGAVRTPAMPLTATNPTETPGIVFRGISGVVGPPGYARYPGAPRPCRPPPGSPDPAKEIGHETLAYFASYDAHRARDRTL